MTETQIPVELISNFLAIVILVLLFVKYYQYKKKLEVIKKLDELKKENKLSSEDKEFIKTNLKDYKGVLASEENRLKFVYPLFILIAGVLLAFFEFEKAMIHLNVIVVAYIYLHVSKLHAKNFVTFLTELNKEPNS